MYLDFVSIEKMYPYIFFLNIVGYQITDVVQSTSLVTEVEEIKKNMVFFP